jgi:hypothetical protein
MTFQNQVKKNINCKILDSIFYNYKTYVSFKKQSKFVYWIKKSLTKKELEYLFRNHPFFKKYNLIPISFNKNSINKALRKFDKNFYFKYNKIVLKSCI